MSDAAATAEPVPPKGLAAWQVTPVGMAILCALFYFGVISGLWALFNRDTFQIYFDGYARSDTSAARRRNHARFRQTAPADANERLARILEAPESTPAERLAAVELIGDTGNDAIFPVLKKQWQNSADPRLKAAAIVSMGAVQSAEARDALTALIDSGTADERLSAIEAVRTHRRNDLAAAVRRIVSSGTPPERLAAVNSAAAISGLEKDLLQAHLTDADPAVRLAAARAMREIPRPKLTSVLGPLMANQWVPVQPDLPRRRQNQIQRQLDASFLLMIEDALAQLQEGDPDIACGSGDECDRERNFYRDLLRRRSTVRTEVIGFQKGKRSLYFVNAAWSSGTTPRYALLAMVLPADHRDAVFPVRELTFGPIAGRESVENAGSLGKVISVTGQLRDENIRVEILEPDGRATLYSFQNGLFHTVMPVQDNSGSASGEENGQAK